MPTSTPEFDPNAVVGFETDYGKEPLKPEQYDLVVRKLEEAGIGVIPKDREINYHRPDADETYVRDLVVPHEARERANAIVESIQDLDTVQGVCIYGLERREFDRALTVYNEDYPDADLDEEAVDTLRSEIVHPLFRVQLERGDVSDQGLLLYKRMRKLRADRMKAA